MAKKGTTGYKAELARRQGARRIARLESVISGENIPQRTRNWAEKQIKEIKSAMQGTRQYSKTGKRYKSKSKGYIEKQINRLARAIKEVPSTYTVEGDSFMVTQREINRASVGAPSIYTKHETHLFYRATQKIWNKEGVDEHSRNEAILDYFNDIRAENGLSPLRLDQVVSFVLDSNETVTINLANYEDEMEMTEEQQRYYADMDDGGYGSPTNISEAVLDGIKDALSDLLVMPDVTEF